jgi:hypothetical protein
MPDEFTPEEKAYVESRGEQGPQVAEDTQEPIAAEPEPAKAEATPEPAKSEPEPEKTVPLSAVQEERRRRKEAEKQAHELRAQYERLNGRLDVLQRGDQQPQQQYDPSQEDPLARLERIEAMQRQDVQMRQVQAVHQQLGTHFDQAAAEFSRAEPAFGDAIKHLVESRKQELAALPGIDPAQVNALVGQDMVNFLQGCAAQGINPAERAWQWAQARGFRKADPAPTVDHGKSVAAEMDRISRGQAAAKSLGTAGGAPGGEITLDALDSMDLKEFGKLIGSDQGKKDLRRLFGG